MKIDNLPKWAREHIKTLERQRDVAVRALNDFINDQTPSEIWFEDAVCIGGGKGPSFKRRYIQSSKVSIEHEGVCLDILIRDNHIDMQWSGSDHRLTEIAFIPESYQKCRLVHKNRMR